MVDQNMKSAVRLLRLVSYTAQVKIT